jgi:serine/threonine protein kinase
MSTPPTSTPGALPSPPTSPSKEQRSPYVEGAKFLARRHEPPTTFEMGYHERHRRRPKVPDDATHLDWCLAHPPAPGTTHTEDTRYIDISKCIRTGENCGAQIVLTVDGFVAKLYDPLYYEFPDREYPDENLNVTDSADEEYITEAAAYLQLLDTPLQGTITPKYHGSWTLDMPVVIGEQQQPREVRMIIIEYVPGTSMQEIDPTTLIQQERENIMLKLIEADIDLRFSGVRHDDLEPRNVILSLAQSDSTDGSQDLRICIFDFGHCAILNHEGRRLGPYSEVRNPLYYWTTSFEWSDWGWLPPQEEANEWMWKNWEDGGKEGKYVKVERDPNSKFGKPKRPEVKRA